MKSKELLKKIKYHISEQLAQFTYSRKCRLYCIGAAKTGTHSIDSMFDQTIRSSHEADSEEVIAKILDLSAGKLQDKEVLAFIRKRDKRLRLDVDSSQLNFFLLDFLLKEFPQALYLLTIRDCYSWLDSFMNDSLRRTTTDRWIQLRDFRFQASFFSHPPEELPLKERGLYTLNGYLSYWASHNNKVLTSVPKERLMIVRTNELTQKAYEIADFAGLPRTSIQLKHSHAFKNPTKYHLLREIPEAYLESKIQEYCGPLMERFFSRD